MNRLEKMMATAIAETTDEAAAIERFSRDLLATNDVALLWEVFPEIVRGATLLRLARHVEWLRKQNSSAAQRDHSESARGFGTGEPKSDAAQNISCESKGRLSAPDAENMRSPFDDSKNHAGNSTHVPATVSDAARTLAHYQRPTRDAVSANRRIERAESRKSFWDDFYTIDGKCFSILTRVGLERVIKTQTPMMAEFARRLLALMPESARRKDTVARNLSETEGRKAWKEAQETVKSAAD